MILICLFRSLSSNFRVMASINILDPSGFRNPASCGRNTGATFEDFCHNYIQERLQLLFHDTVFTTTQDLYSQVCSFNARYLLKGLQFQQQQHNILNWLLSIQVYKWWWHSICLEIIEITLQPNGVAKSWKKKLNATVVLCIAT